MTAQEAIRRIKDHNRVHQRKEPFAVHITEALDEAVAALDKQVPKKPVLCCPVCGGPVTNYGVRGAKPQHCQFCGQAIDGEVEEA